MVKMTLKQQRFADEYIISGNATSAAIAAGYSEKTARVIATENLTKPAISTYIKERLDDLQSPKVADQEEILQFLTAVVRGEVTEPVAILDGAGRQRIEELLPSVQTRKGAAEQLGKRYAMWTDKQQLDITAPVTIVNDLDD